MRYIPLLVLLWIFPCRLSASQVDISWIHPKETLHEVGKHQKMEIGISTPPELKMYIQQFFRNASVGLNPFEPKDINLCAEFIAPSGKRRKIYGFYYQPYQRDLKQDVWLPDTTSFDWRVRFAPDETGPWLVNITLETRNIDIHAFTQSKFVCNPSDSEGYLMTEPGKPFLKFSESKRTFFAIGHNITHASYDELSPKDAAQHLIWLEQLATNGGNFFRLELGGQCYLPDWYNAVDYSRQLPSMWELDQMIDQIENLNLYFILFRHHVEVMDSDSDWPIVQWGKNPYKKAFDISREQYYTDAEMLRLQKNTLRYIFSRWGYSTSFAMYSYSELDNFYKDYMKENNLNEKQALTTLTKWLKEMSDFYKDELGYTRILYMNTYAALARAEKSNPKKFAFNLNDVNGIHKYGETKDINYNWNYNEARTVWEKWKKPLIFEEMGYNANPESNMDFVPFYCCTPIDFYHNTWATSMMNTFGTGMHWWWDRGIHLNGYYVLYKNINGFYTQTDLASMGTPKISRWRDYKNSQKTTLESYYQISEEKHIAVGWVGNATYHWRNMMGIDSCMKHIKETGRLKDPCISEDNIRIAENGVKAEFSDPRFEDKYTATGGAKNFESGEKTMKIKGLLRNTLYEITFYHAIPGESIGTDHSMETKTGVTGKMKVVLPALNAANTSFAYTIKSIR